MQKVKELKELIELSLIMEKWFEEFQIPDNTRSREIFPIRFALKKEIIELIISINKKAKQSDLPF